MEIASDLDYELTAGLWLRWNCRFPPARQRSHERALINTYSDVRNARELNRLRSFMKVEQLLHSSDYEVKDGDSRPIQGGSDEHAVLVGPYIWALYKSLGRHFSKHHPFLFFTSGSNAEDLGEWFDDVGHGDPSWHYVDEDFSRWDSSIIRFGLMLLIWLYRRFGLNEYAIELVVADVRKRGITAFGIVYTVKNTVASGRDDTSGGNSVIHGVVGLYIAHMLANAGSLDHASRDSLPHFLERTGYRAAVASDDGIYMMRRSWTHYQGNVVPFHLPTVADWMLHGLTAQINVRTCSYDIEFCSGRFWPTNHGSVYAVKPGRLLSKLGFYINISPMHLPATHRATLLQVRRDFSFLPPVVSFVERQLLLLQVPRQSRHLGRVTGYLVHTAPDSPRHECVAGTWEMLDHLYGWTSIIQDQLESLLSTVTSLPSFIQFAHIENMVRRDTEVPGVPPSGIASVFVLLPRLFAFLFFALILVLGIVMEFAEFGLSRLSDSVERFVSYPFVSSHYRFMLHWPVLNKYCFVMGQCLAEVAVEELYKRWRIWDFPIGWFSLVVSENVLKYASGVSYGILYSTVLHCYCYGLDFPVAVLVHFVYNVIILQLHVNYLAMSVEG